MIRKAEPILAMMATGIHVLNKGCGLVRRAELNKPWALRKRGSPLLFVECVAALIGPFVVDTKLRLIIINPGSVGER